MGSYPRVPARELIAGIAFAVFGFLAYRNAVAASILLVPLAHVALDRGITPVASRVTVPRTLLVVTAALLAASSVVTYVGRANVAYGMPVRIAKELAAEPGQLRVVAPYNTTGFIREFGGDHIRVSIDGRADRYGAKEIRRQSDLLAGRRGWRDTLRVLRPDRVIADRASPIVRLLVQAGWLPVLRDRGYVLLEPSGT